MSADVNSILFKSVTPVLAVENLEDSIVFCREQLGFTLYRIWDAPRKFAAVGRGDVTVQLIHDPTLAATAEGHEIIIGVRNLKDLYIDHQLRGASIILPFHTTEYGADEYTVREPNGYHLHFIAPKAPLSASKPLPLSIRFTERALTIAEYRHLTESVGWKGLPETTVNRTLLAACYSVVAETESGDLVGGLVLLTDVVSGFYLRDVMVHPDWQGQHIGTEMMQKLMDWLGEKAPPGLFVRLDTDESLAPFYASFGFTPQFTMSQLTSRRKQ